MKRTTAKAKRENYSATIVRCLIRSYKERLENMEQINMESQKERLLNVIQTFDIADEFELKYQKKSEEEFEEWLNK